MLAQNKPRSFVSGANVDLGAVLKDYNRNEFHHVYPRAYLRDSAQKAPDENCFANMSFLSKTDNNALGGVAPSVYRSKMPNDISQIAKSNFLPDNTFGDNFKEFSEKRAALLLAEAQKVLA